MASNVIFASPKYLDEATILDAPNWLTTAPATETQTMQPRKTAQSNGLSSIYIAYDLVTARALNTFWAVRPNLTTNATWRWRGATSQANLTAAPTYDSGAVNPWRSDGSAGAKPTDEDWEQHLCMLVSSNVTALRYWRVDLIDAGNPESMIEIGRLGAGIRWQPDIGFTYDWGFRFETADLLEETPFGHTFTQERLRPRGGVLPFDSVRRTEVFAQAMTLQRLRGRSGDIFCCLDYTQTTDLHWHSIYGVLKEMGEIGQRFADIYTARFQMREVL